MYHQDWLMRQIEQAVQAAARILFGRDAARPEESEEAGRAGELSVGIHARTEKGRLKEAADFLEETLDPSDMRQVKAALDFYETANRLGDRELAEGGLPREELEASLGRLLAQFGMDALL